MSEVNLKISHVGFVTLLKTARAGAAFKLAAEYITDPNTIIFASMSGSPASFLARLEHESPHFAVYKNPRECMAGGIPHETSNLHAYVIASGAMNQVVKLIHAETGKMSEYLGKLIACCFEVLVVMELIRLDRTVDSEFINPAKAGTRYVAEDIDNLMREEVGGKFWTKRDVLEM